MVRRIGLAVLEPRSRIGSGRNIAAACVAAALAITTLTWQLTTLIATTGTDPSWVAALHLAHIRRLQYGWSFIFTYGPLGYLAFPVAISGRTLIEAFAFAVVTQCIYVYLLIRTAHQTLTLPLAVLGAYLVSSLPLSRSDVLLLIVFLYAISSLTAPATTAARLFPVIAGCTAGTAILMKTNVGGTAATIALLTSLGLLGETGRWPKLVVPALVVTVATLWIATGNSLVNIAGWLRLSVSIVAGYSPAMQFNDGLTWELLIAAIVLTLLAVCANRLVEGYERRRRIVVLTVGAIFAFASFKEGFVRQDSSHTPYFFTAMAVALTAFARTRNVRWPALGGIAICALAINITVGVPLHPLASAKRAWEQLSQTTTTAKRSALIRDSASYQRSVYGVYPNQLAELQGQTVAVYPYETAAISAYDLAWRPIPTVQAYPAYTATLDEQNARLLTSTRAPGRILRQSDAVGIAGRNQELEAPATFRAIICNYAQMSVTETWQVLAHTLPRCDEPRFLSSSTVASGDTIPVPRGASDDVIFARVYVRDTLWNRILGILYKPRVPTVVLGDDPPVPLVSATSSDGIVLCVPTSAGYDKRYDGGRAWTTLSVWTVTGKVRVDFYASALHPT